jgi:hypothetical protein
VAWVVIDSRHPIELNGVLYHLAESEEGSHYDVWKEPLRSPNAVLVTGDKNPSFDTRDDLLVWKITDWSGGEGQRKFDPQAPSRMYQIENLDPFSEPGSIFLGPDWEVMLDEGAAELGHELGMAKGAATVIGVNTTPTVVADGSGFIWDTAHPGEWDEVNNTTAGADDEAAYGGVVGDEQNTLFYIEAATDEVYSYDAGGAYTLLNDQTGATGASPMVGLGQYLYVYDLVNAKVFEISRNTPNTTTPETAILDLSTKGGTETINNGIGMIFTSANRIYVLQIMSDETVLWEIVPTTAAGTGYGLDVARFEGFKGETGWTHLGTVFLIGTDRADNNNRIILYWIPGGNYGSLGAIRRERGVTAGANPPVSGQGGALLTSVFALAPHNGYTSLANSKTGLWMVDSVTGGFACIAIVGTGWDGTAVEATVSSIVEWEGEYFISLTDGTTEDVLRTLQNTYSGDPGVFTTPSYDFGLVDSKVLESIKIETEPLPADTTVVVEYQLDGGSWVTAGTMSTDGDTTDEYVISTDSTTREFASLRVRCRLTSTTNTNTPVVRELQVRASVLAKVRRWSLMLDLNDDHSAGRQSHRGSQKVTNVETLGTTGSVVDFKDGYKDRRSGHYTQTDVRVDKYHISLERAGEGVARVELVEVDGAVPAEFPT